jgi:hypothetical protein
MKAKILLIYLIVKNIQQVHFILNYFSHLTHNVIKQVILLAPHKGRYVTTNF